jgi:hypothetical protein
MTQFERMRLWDAQHHVEADGKRWRIWHPCIFCSNTAAVAYDSQGQYDYPQGVDAPCPANGNAPHIRPFDYPDEILAIIKKSRGIA